MLQGATSVECCRNGAGPELRLLGQLLRSVSALHTVTLCLTACMVWAECGKRWMYTTITYMSDDPVAEWAAAVTACLFFAFAGGAITAIRAQSIACIPEPVQTAQYSARQVAVLFGIWVPFICVASIPSFMYGLSVSTPADNTIGISSTVIALFHNGAGLILSIINGFVVPQLASTLIRTVNSGKTDQSAALNLTMAARLCTALIVPFVTVLVLNQECFAKWLLLWEGCESSSSYDIKLTMSSGFTPRLLVQHSDVCSPGYKSHRCPRAMTDVLGSLITQKLLFVTFVGCPITLALSTPQVRAAREWLVRNVLRQRDYEVTVSVDREVAGVNMLVLSTMPPLQPVVADKSVLAAGRLNIHWCLGAVYLRSCHWCASLWR